MFMFLDEAAETTASTASSLLSSNWLFFGMIALIIIVFYFLVIRPQKKQEKEQNTMKNSLREGDEITTIGGIVGCVVRVKDDIFTIVTSKERTRISFQRSALRSIDHRAGEPYNQKEDTPAVTAPAEKPAGLFKFGKNKKTTDSETGNSDKTE
jgi:preprotein translocase subunit YajC